jgi:hypothetical protein
MLCTNFVKLTSTTAKTPQGRCKFYNQVVEQKNCQKKDGHHVQCFKVEFPIQVNGRN